MFEILCLLHNSITLKIEAFIIPVDMVFYTLYITCARQGMCDKVIMWYDFFSLLGAISKPFYTLLLTALSRSRHYHIAKSHW